MGPLLRRRLDRILFWRTFRHPVWGHLDDLQRQLRRLHGQELWGAHARAGNAKARRIEDWEVT